MTIDILKMFTAYQYSYHLWLQAIRYTQTMPIFSSKLNVAVAPQEVKNMFCSQS
jgi:hypothetical protein